MISRKTFLRQLALMVGMWAVLVASVTPHHHHGSVPCVAEEACVPPAPAGGERVAHAGHQGCPAHQACEARPSFVATAVLRLADVDGALEAFFPLVLLLASLLPPLLAGGVPLPCPDGQPAVPLPDPLLTRGGRRGPPSRVC